MAGYIQLSRGLFKHWLWQERREFSRAEAWLDIINMAAYQDYQKLVGATPILIERGQLLASERFLESRWQWGRKKVRVFLDRLAREQMIVISTHHLGNRVTVCKYEDYNGKGPPQWPTKEPVMAQGRTKENKVNTMNTMESLADTPPPPPTVAPKRGKSQMAQILCDIPLMLASIPGFESDYLAYLERCAGVKRPVNTARAQQIELDRLITCPDQARGILGDAIEGGLKIAWVLERRASPGPFNGNGKYRDAPQANDWPQVPKAFAETWCKANGGTMYPKWSMMLPHEKQAIREAHAKR